MPNELLSKFMTSRTKPLDIEPVLFVVSKIVMSVNSVMRLLALRTHRRLGYMSVSDCVIKRGPCFDLDLDVRKLSVFSSLLRFLIFQGTCSRHCASLLSLRVSEKCSCVHRFAFSGLIDSHDTVKAFFAATHSLFRIAVTFICFVESVNVFQESAVCTPFEQNFHTTSIQPDGVICYA